MKNKKTGGRKKGSLNKATREIKAFTSTFLSSPTYVASAKKRILDGGAPHLEALWHHYAFGKPKETVAVEEKPAPVFAIACLPSFSPDPSLPRGAQ
jgi:hypothetical protein